MSHELPIEQTPATAAEAPAKGSRDRLRRLLKEAEEYFLKGQELLSDILDEALLLREMDNKRLEYRYTSIWVAKAANFCGLVANTISECRIAMRKVKRISGTVPVEVDPGKTEPPTKPEKAS